jgi:hypothetical protein
MIEEKIGNVITTPEYWDCECKENYIHSITEKSCSICGAVAENQPDSIVNEVKKLIGAK